MTQSNDASHPFQPLREPLKTWAIRADIPGTSHNWWVGFLVGQNLDPSVPVNKHQLGLMAGDTPPHDALQFARELDARRFVQAYLLQTRNWIIEGPGTPPVWSYAAPPEAEESIQP